MRFIIITNYKSDLQSIFADVQPTHWAWQDTTTLYYSNITAGCSTSPLQFCPNRNVTRREMAVFLLRLIHGANYIPPAVGSSTGFSDVSISDWGAPWIKQLAAENITSGCGNGNYCPDSNVTHAQMSVFLLKSKRGSSYFPPNLSPTFPDTVSHWAEDWITQAYNGNLTSGSHSLSCYVGFFCPENSVSRAEMANMLVRAMNTP